MGRPRGSKNRRSVKRRRARRAKLPAANGSDSAERLQADALSREIKTMLMDADPAVAQLAIHSLLDDLTMVAKIVNSPMIAP